MPDIDRRAHRMVVTDAFAIRSRGVVLQPSLPVDAFAHGTRLAVHTTAPDGTQRLLEGRFLLEHLNLGPHGSKWNGIVVLDEGSAHPPAGTVIVALPSGDTVTPTSIDGALALLAELGAVPHLVQHHRLVAEAATELCDGLAEASLDSFDRTEVLVGAALHDVGKTLHPAEMHGNGSEHEQAGYRLLREHGIPEPLARHARTHAAWEAQHDLEPVLVALADKLWKGKRVTELEEHTAKLLATASGRDFWAVWSELDPLFERIAASADDRLARSTR